MTLKDLLLATDDAGVPYPADRCVVSGLPIVRRPEWENIRVTEDYHVSFFVIAGRILYTIPVGSASDQGSYGFVNHRRRVLEESGLDRGTYAEIADYGYFRGNPSRDVRLYFKKLITEETEAGKLRGIWVFNASTLIRWYYNVGGALYRNRLPVAAVRHYADAVQSALNALGIRNIDGVTFHVPEHRHPEALNRYQDELLHYIGAINWETEGLPEEPCGPPHPFEQVFGALGILKQDMDDLNRKNRETARELAETNRMLESRNTRLQTLTEYLIHTEEREKKKIADDLHDGLAQTMALLIAKVKTSTTLKAPMSLDELRQMQELLETSLKEMRTLSFQLSPPELDNGLVPALEWMVAELAERQGLAIELAVRMEISPELNDTMTLVLYRAVRELIRNITKHSGEMAARVILSGNKNTLNIRVEDKGKGFDTAAMERETPLTFGLFSINERLKTFGGRMDVTSSPGRGTTVILTAPLHPPDTT